MNYASADLALLGPSSAKWWLYIAQVSWKAHPGFRHGPPAPVPPSPGGLAHPCRGGDPRPRVHHRLPRQLQQRRQTLHLVGHHLLRVMELCGGEPVGRGVVPSGVVLAGPGDGGRGRRAPVDPPVLEARRAGLQERRPRQVGQHLALAAALLLKEHLALAAGGVLHENEALGPAEWRHGAAAGGGPGAGHGGARLVQCRASIGDSDSDGCVAQLRNGARPPPDTHAWPRFQARNVPDANGCVGGPSGTPVL